MLHRSNPQGTSMFGKLWSVLLENPLLEDQFRILSDIPIHHKWKWDKPVKILRHEQKFSNSCKYFPGSPRNRILQASIYRVGSESIILSLFKNVFGIKETVTYPSRKEKLFLIVSKAKKSRISFEECSLDQEFQYNYLPCGNKVVSNNIGTISSNEVF
ncbi:uncharacterized protein LOC136095076 [Hydra vulgaris]|uniref:uncharacterized protein LOC136095076 n=1 Tax=Hydra vulgaris TaxID=6087 RepID=UPI0032EA2735